MRHPFRVSDMVMALRDQSDCIIEGEVYRVSCISMEQSWSGDTISAYVGFVCDYADDKNVAAGKETNWLAKNFTLVERDGRKDYSCRNPLNEPAIGVKLP